MRDDFNKTEWKTFSESLNKFKKECTIDLLNNTAIYIYIIKIYCMGKFWLLIKLKR